VYIYYSLWADVQEEQRWKMFSFLFHMTSHISRDTDQQYIANGFELKYKPLIQNSTVVQEYKFI